MLLQSVFAKGRVTRGVGISLRLARVDYSSGGAASATTRSPVSQQCSKIGVTWKGIFKPMTEGHDPKRRAGTLANVLIMDLWITLCKGFLKAQFHPPLFQVIGSSLAVQAPARAIGQLRENFLFHVEGAMTSLKGDNIAIMSFAINLQPGPPDRSASISTKYELIHGQSGMNGKGGARRVTDQKQMIQISEESDSFFFSSSLVSVRLQLTTSAKI